MMPPKCRKHQTTSLNMMVVGAVGCGKTNFIRTLCKRMEPQMVKGSLSHPDVLRGPLVPTEAVCSISMQLEQHNKRTCLTMIDTPGLVNGFTIGHQLWHLFKYIDLQFERTFVEEAKIVRDIKSNDTRIHVCIYFIDTNSMTGPSSHDCYMLKLFSSRVNVIPVIGKADTLSASEQAQLKAVLRLGIEHLNIPVYGFFHTAMNNGVKEDDNDEDDYLTTVPFTVIGSEQNTNENTLGRRYPWGFVKCFDRHHCDFERLVHILLSGHGDRLRLHTRECHYEQYRMNRLISERIDEMVTLKTKQHHPSSH